MKYITLILIFIIVTSASYYGYTTYTQNERDKVYEVFHIVKENEIGVTYWAVFIKLKIYIKEPTIQDLCKRYYEENIKGLNSKNPSFYIFCEGTPIFEDKIKRHKTVAKEVETINWILDTRPTYLPDYKYTVQSSDEDSETKLSIDYSIIDKEKYVQIYKIKKDARDKDIISRSFSM